jgi:ABC-type lipoprotein release transport system permease subunit
MLAEALHRRVWTALTLVAVTVASACLVGAMSLLDAHDASTEQVLEQRQQDSSRQMAKLEDDMRKVMLRLGFNIVILPRSQSLEQWHLEDQTSSFMPADYAQKLGQSRVVTIQHLLPILQQKIQWPERRRGVILVGVREEMSEGKKPLVQPVPGDKIVLGYELHDSLGLKVGDVIELMGRKFTVHQCYPMRGNKDDMTLWVRLEDAQDILGKPGLISAIQAVECECAWADLPRVREEIGKLLPDVQVIERGSEALARAEARRRVGDEARAALARETEHRQRMRAELERSASVLVAVVLCATAAWVALLTLQNARERRGEIGVLRALGVRGRQVMLLLVFKAVLAGLLGSAVGIGVGQWAGWRLGAALEQAALVGSPLAHVWRNLAVVFVAGPLLCCIASWLPAMLAAQQDPARILRED